MPAATARRVTGLSHARPPAQGQHRISHAAATQFPGSYDGGALHRGPGQRPSFLRVQPVPTGSVDGREATARARCTACARLRLECRPTRVPAPRVSTARTYWPRSVEFPASSSTTRTRAQASRTGFISLQLVLGAQQRNHHPRLRRPCGECPMKAAHAAVKRPSQSGLGVITVHAGPGGAGHTGCRHRSGGQQHASADPGAGHCLASARLVGRPRRQRMGPVPGLQRQLDQLRQAASQTLDLHGRHRRDRVTRHAAQR